METWRLIDLGMVEPLKAQTFYEAVASAVDKGRSPNTIILCQPKAPYVCIGYHQELEKEIDVEYCRANNIPLIRRSQGGGAVYLDENQIFYQVVARRESQTVPARVEELFEKFLNVTVYVYRKLGLPAEFKALNDVVVNGRKISGNGASRFGENTIILVGNIILDLNYELMARVLKAPDEKFRDKMAKSVKDWVTSIKRELGYVPDPRKVKPLLVQGYEETLGIELTPSTPTKEEERTWEEEIKPRHLSREWLYREERFRGVGLGRAIKIADGVKVVQVDHKARKLIRVTAELIGEKILSVTFSGDFFAIPEDGLTVLESRLRNSLLNREALLEKVETFYEETGIQTPGIEPKDFVEAIMKLKESAETYSPLIYPYANNLRSKKK
ncbi:TPA: lipoate--protein ligase family protein [Candidatus Bathyarchaeota archaeon]|nr:lipoate--protein ligase family protein [Candidatus Bathyarchaeota archaeon]